MTDANQIRQKVQQARKLAKQGKPAQAKALLKGIDHPKAIALAAQLDDRIAARLTGTAKFPLLPVAGLMSIVLVLLAGSFFLMNAFRQQPAAANLVLPTLIPTSDCTGEIVQTWWQVQDTELAGFAADASSASRTMPGERLTVQIDRLRQFRDNFPAPPVCASPEMQKAIATALGAMNDTIAAAERWNNGEVDGTRATNEFDVAENDLRQAKMQVRQALLK